MSLCRPYFPCHRYIIITVNIYLIDLYYRKLLPNTLLSVMLVNQPSTTENLLGIY